ncbi:hypothetical protein NM208_g11389 [Fusarium decemcellulare]|uniref:Uncharacterized protein n=1 Tax=Fusarium decemcellulare TaxID=57161 RepID=A0ACC1RSS9_9HYPO|nr:hypothetical protein NM208_g11389 [Fusarium decemcellulare]
MGSTLTTEALSRFALVETWCFLGLPMASLELNTWANEGTATCHQVSIEPSWWPRSDSQAVFLNRASNPYCTWTELSQEWARSETECSSELSLAERKGVFRKWILGQSTNAVRQLARYVDPADEVNGIPTMGKSAWVVIRGSAIKARRRSVPLIA